MIFEPGNQAIERKRVSQRRDRAVEGGRMLEAGAAHRAFGGGRRAPRTLRRLVPGQAVAAAGAERARAGRAAAEQAGAGGEVIEK